MRKAGGETGNTKEMSFLKLDFSHTWQRKCCKYVLYNFKNNIFPLLLSGEVTFHKSIQNSTTDKSVNRQSIPFSTSKWYLHHIMLARPQSKLFELPVTWKKVLLARDKLKYTNFYTGPILPIRGYDIRNKEIIFNDIY